MPFKKGEKHTQGGRKSIAAEFSLVRSIDAYSPLFWKKLTAMIESDDKELVKFAMAEFNKLQLKRMPTVVEGNPDKPLSIHIDQEVANKTLYELNRNTEVSGTE